MSSPGPTMLMRVDASAQIGMGHLMRCVALAQAFRRTGGNVAFALHAPPSAVRRMLDDRGFEAHEVGGAAADFAALVAGRAPAAVVLDGYHFDDDFQEIARREVRCSVMIDDLADRERYVTDIVVNGNVFAADLEYATRPETRLLAGADYALLREEFVRFERPARTTDRPRVLFTFGGADPLGLSERILAVLARSAFAFDAIFLVGAACPRIEAVTAAAKVDGVTLLEQVADVPALLAGVDLAVAAAGSTCLELAFMGVPALLVTTSPNQVPVAAKLDSLQVAVDLGDASKLDDASLPDRIAALLADGPKRAAMAARGRALVDGRGAGRVTDAILEELR